MNFTEWLKVQAESDNHARELHGFAESLGDNWPTDAQDRATYERAISLEPEQERRMILQNSFNTLWQDYQQADQADPQGGSRTAGGGREADARDRLRRVTGRLRRVTESSWWRTNFRDNFSIEYELDAKIDRLEIWLASLPDTVVPSMSAQLREELQKQLQAAGRMLADSEPFERVMQRINFVEAEIMMRLADDRIGLTLEALRAEASISLPDPAGKLILEEIDKIAASGEDAASRKVRLVGLKTRLGASVIELFRGSERARDSTQILGLALMALTLFLGGLFYQNNELSRALFTHYGMTATLQLRDTGSTPASADQATDVAQLPNGPQAAGQTPPDPAPALPPAADAAQAPTVALSELVQVIPHGEAPLIDLAFPVVLMAAAFGGIGACLSGLFSFTLQGRVPNEYEGYFRTLIRPIIGIASGFLAVFILRGGLFTFGDDLAWVAIVALVFGFSERLFIGTMARLEGLPR